MNDRPPSGDFCAPAPAPDAAYEPYTSYDSQGVQYGDGSGGLPGTGYDVPGTGHDGHDVYASGQVASTATTFVPQQPGPTDPYATGYPADTFATGSYTPGAFAGAAGFGGDPLFGDLPGATAQNAGYATDPYGTAAYAAPDPYGAYGPYATGAPVGLGDYGTGATAPAGWTGQGLAGQDQWATDPYGLQAADTSAYAYGAPGHEAAYDAALQFPAQRQSLEADLSGLAPDGTYAGHPDYAEYAGYTQHPGAAAAGYDTGATHADTAYGAPGEYGEYEAYGDNGPYAGTPQYTHGEPYAGDAEQPEAGYAATEYTEYADHADGAPYDENAEYEDTEYDEYEKNAGHGDSEYGFAADDEAPYDEAPYDDGTDDADVPVVSASPAPARPRGSRGAKASGGRTRRRAPARRSALLTVAVPSVCVIGVAGAAAASVVGTGGDSTSAAAVKPAAANNKLDAQMDGLSADTRDFADRASRTQQRLDIKAQQEAKEEAAKKKAAAEAARKERLRPKFVLPVTQHGLSAYFGQTSEHWMTIHTGIDFPVAYGTQVMAATDGVVSFKYNVSYGNMAIVTAKDGTQTWYCHLSSYKVDSGTSVKAGDVIAFSGNSGNTTGPHLHFEVRPGGGSPIDPLPWLRSHGLNPE